MKRLSTLDILKEIDKDFYAKRYFKGVFARDNIPVIITYPCSLILNTDPSTRPGEHWLALFFNSKKEAEFFDSFGNDAQEFGLGKYIKRFSIKIVSNNVQLQSFDSNACGYYCLYFILLKSRGFTLTEIISLFSKILK